MSSRDGAPLPPAFDQPQVELQPVNAVGRDVPLVRRHVLGAVPPMDLRVRRVHRVQHLLRQPQHSTSVPSVISDIRSLLALGHGLRRRLEADLAVRPVAERLVRRRPAAAQRHRVLPRRDGVSVRVRQLEVAPHDQRPVLGDVNQASLPSYPPQSPARALPPPAWEGVGGRFFRGPFFLLALSRPAVLYSGNVQERLGNMEEGTMAEPQYVSMNGKLLPKEQALCRSTTTALLYGDGLFEGIRVYKGRVFKLDEHVARLYFSAKALNIVIPAPPEGHPRSHSGDRPRQRPRQRLHPRHRHARHRPGPGPQAHQGRRPMSTSPASSSPCTRRRCTRTA